jgi:hypothetical protein
LITFRVLFMVQADRRGYEAHVSHFSLNLILGTPQQGCFFEPSR